MTRLLRSLSGEVRLGGSVAQIVFCFFVLVSLVSCGSPSKPDPQDARLLLFLSVDQLRPDYLTRFRPLFNGGFKQLLEKGSLFVDAHYEHSNTATCPGHAVLVTGVHPSRSGIVANWWFDRKSGKEMYCVHDSRYKRSPKNLLVSSLPDWVNERSWWNKVYSVSGKDRSSIMLGGRDATAAFWYDKDSGEIASSNYYPEPAPKWLKRFNGKRYLRKFFGSTWEALPVSEEDLKNAKITLLDEGSFPKRFPHVMGSAELTPSKRFFRGIYSTPFVDEYVAEFAKELITREKLGKDSKLDYLAISFSALDTVGHGYGPNSPEVLDTMLRLDQTLADLLGFIDKKIGLDKVLVALTSDHGVQPLPELLHQEGRMAHRQNALDAACAQGVGKRMSDRHGVQDLFLDDQYFDYSIARRKGIPLQQLEREIKDELEQCKMVERVWTRTELLSKKGSDSPYFVQFQRSFHPQRSGDYLLQLKKNHLHSMHRGTGHGSPYDYDTHVPVIIAGPGIQEAAVIGQRISNVDVAPTLASLLRLEFPKNLDGTDRSKLISDGQP